jgi:hypothetical protein
VGLAPLHAAAKKGKTDVIQVLLSRGANVNAICEERFTEREERGDQLVDLSVNLRYTPLDLVPRGARRALRALHKAGARHGQSFLKARALNRKGLARLKRRRYRQARAAFERALRAFPAHHEATYNLARALARLTTAKRGRGCNERAYFELLAVLRRLVKKDRRVVHRVKGDAAFGGVRRYLLFRELVDGLRFKNAHHVRHYVVGKTYATSCPGSDYCPVETLTLHHGGRWSGTYHKNASAFMKQLGSGTKPPRLIIGKRSGRWRLEGHTLVLHRRRGAVKRLKVLSPGQIGSFYYPHPNDMSGEQAPSCGTDVHFRDEIEEQTTSERRGPACYFD